MSKLDEETHFPFVDVKHPTPFRKRDDYDPYVNLWMNVMNLAISDMDSVYESLRKPAKNWIFSQSKLPGSFKWICDHTGLDWFVLQTACMSRSRRQSIVKSQQKHQKDVQKLKGKRK